MLFSLAANYRRDQEPPGVKGKPAFSLPGLWLILSPCWLFLALTALQVESLHHRRFPLAGARVPSLFPFTQPLKQGAD